MKISWKMTKIMIMFIYKLILKHSKLSINLQMG